MSNPTINSVHLVGHVGADPKIKFLDLNTCSARISLATNAEGAINEEDVMVRGMVTDWHTILCYRELAEMVDKSIGTGDLIEVEGRLTYLQQRGPIHNKYKAVVLAHAITILKKKERKAVEQAPPVEELHTAYGEYLDTLSSDPDDLPF